MFFEVQDKIFWHNKILKFVSYAEKRITDPKSKRSDLGFVNLKGAVKRSLG